MRRHHAMRALRVALLGAALSVQAADFSTWSRTLPIQFSGYTIPGTLTNFPALVVFRTNMAGFSYADFRSGTHDDLRFTASNGTDELSYDVESWNTNGSSYVWVKVPRLDDSNTSIRAYWGLTGQTAPAYTTNGNTWSEGFVGVWHLSEAATNLASLRADSSGRGHPGYTSTNVAKAADSPAGGADEFNAMTNYVVIPTNAGYADFDLASNYVVSGWFRMAAGDRYDYRSLICKETSSSTRNWWINVNTNGFVWWRAYGNTQPYLDVTSTVSYADSQWHQFSAVVDGTIARLYCDGVSVSKDTSIGTPQTPSEPIYIGSERTVSNRYFKGGIDEVRIASVVRQTNWVWAEYRTMASNATFTTYGQIANPSVPAILNTGASNITDHADACGYLSSTGAAPATVLLYSGPSDGGTNAAAWAATNRLEAPQPAGPVTVNIPLPGANGSYYFRYCATNACGASWAPSTFSFAVYTIDVAATDPSAIEGGADTGAFTVSRPPDLTNDAVTVNYTLGGTAVYGTDYTADHPSSVVIPAGASNATVTITALADTDYLETDETVTLTLAPGSYLIGAANAATVTVANVLPSTVALVSGSGDDTAGNGSLAHPYRSLTRALTNTPAYTLVYVGSGTYTTNSGESFPLAVPAGTSLLGLGTPQDAVIDAGSTNRGLTLNGAGTTNVIANLSLIRTRGTAIVATHWQGTVSNVVISDVANGSAMQSCSVIYYTNNASRTLVFSGVTISNVACNVDKFWWFRGIGSVLFTNCTLRSLSTSATLTSNGAFLFTDRDGNVYNTGGFTAQFADCLIDGLTMGAGDNTKGAFVTGNGPGTTLTFERCRVQNVTCSGNGLMLFAPFHGTGYVRNSLFRNVQCGTVYNAIGGYQSTVHVRNCTFDNVGAAFRPADDGTSAYFMYVYNCVLNNCGALNRKYPDLLFVNNVDLFNTPTNIGYNVANSTNVTFDDPWFVDAANGDFHLRTLSPLVDAGSSAVSPGSLDLDRSPRIQDGNADGTAVVDVGAFEANFTNPASPRFMTAVPVYNANEDQELSIPVWIQPPAAGPVTATVTYGTNVSGSATLNFPTGTETNTLAISVQSPLTVPNGTLVAVSLAESGTAQGVAAGDIGLRLFTSVVTVPGYQARAFVRNGETNQYRVQMPQASLTAASDITISVGSVGGTGSNEVQWVGSNVITAGGWRTEGVLQVVGRGGENTITLGIGSGLTFAESGAATLAFDFAGYASPLYLTPAGNDATGLGTPAAPLRSLTFAAPLLRAGDEARLAAGLYSTNSGEAFPITVPEGIGVHGVVGANADTSDSAVIDADGTGFNFILGTLGPDPGIQGPGGLYDLVMTDARGTAIRARYWGGTVSNCVIRNVASGGAQDSTAALRVENGSRAVTLADVTITNITTTAARMIFMDGGATATVRRCRFQNLALSGQASDGVFAFEDYAVTIADCVFGNTTWPEPSNVLLGGFLRAFKNTGAKGTLTIERCVFHDLSVATNGGSMVVCANGITSASIRNSLFYNIATDVRPVVGFYQANPQVRNCTIDGASAAFRGTTDTNVIFVYNTSVSACTSLCSSAGSRLRLYNVNTYATPGGTGYDTTNSTNVTSFDPQYRYAAQGNYQLLLTSPLVDAGNTNYVSGSLDLALTNRILGASVDIGAYEAVPQPRGSVFTVE